MINPFVRKVHMFSNACDNHACPLSSCLFHHDLSHDIGIGVIQMADGFICKDKVEGLHEGPDHRHALLLSKGHPPDLGIQLIGNP